MSLIRKKLKVISFSFIVIALLAMLLPLSVAAHEHGPCGDPYTPIYEIQGDGWESPFHGEDVVTEESSLLIYRRVRS